MSGRDLAERLLEGDLGGLPRKAGYSRAALYRMFQAMAAEAPGAMRRRLLLERAAWQLGRTRVAVTEIAFDAGYDSLEAFTRAFKRAFGMSPSLYRRSGCFRIHLPAPNSFHYGGPGGPRTGALDMDLFDLFAGTDAWYTRKLLDHAATLTDEQLDRPIPSTSRGVFGWDRPDRNVREILERMVLTKAAWAAALTGGPMPEMELPPEQRSPRALRERFERVEADFQRVLSVVRQRNAWDETFVDALCEPPERFTFGGMFAHVVTFNTQRRFAALDAFHRLGVPMQGLGCPMEYEAEQRKVAV
jgi:AraC family transcriptional regulator